MKGEKKEAYITANDGVRIAYQCFGSEGPVVVLLHGATFSLPLHRPLLLTQELKYKLRSQ